ncbi:Smr/MutS family protein [Ottowia thiooxydans]|uniref:Smr/MutS family protein n=1 Tax=Ottowia thiooxydans TaxID=219182 RepID=UPI0004270B51|nr:Smr/MutS family protein [Ottowia thiooxydans]
MKSNSLQDLKKLRQQLAERQAKIAAEESARRKNETQSKQDQDLFAKAIGATKPLRQTDRVVHRPAPALPLPLQRERDEKSVLREAISDEFDASTLLQVDDHLSYLRPGLSPDVTSRLRRGHWAVQREIDLHGFRVHEAREALSAFLREVQRAGVRCVRVVHGKGLGSPGRTPVLKGKVHGWLIQKQEVLAFVQAKPLEGGAGALLVLLQGGRGPG